MLSDKQVWTLSSAELYQELDKAFPEEPWLTWEPETLLRHLPEIKGGTDKVLAVQAVASNLNLVLSVSVAFEKVVHAFNNNVCVMDSPQPAYIEEVFYAVAELKKLAKLVHSFTLSDPAPKLANDLSESEAESDTELTSELDFIGEIPGYVAACGHYHGWVLLPSPLGFAQEMLNYLNGLHPDSAKYKMFADHMQQIEKAASQLDEADLSGDDLSALDGLPEESPLSEFIKRVVGTYLFDPTQGD
jgi:hypothetical protein